MQSEVPHDVPQMSTCSLVARAGQRVLGGHPKTAAEERQQPQESGKHTLIISIQVGWAGTARCAAGLAAAVPEVLLFAAAIVMCVKGMTVPRVVDVIAQSVLDKVE
jgi:hypothetical protein